MAKAKSRGTNIFVKIVLIALIVYLAYCCINSMVRISGEESKGAALDEQISIQNDKNKQYSDIKDADIDEDTAESIARENGFAYSDEKIYEGIS